MPTNNYVFFTAGCHFWWASQKNFGPSYFVRAFKGFLVLVTSVKKNCRISLKNIYLLLRSASHRIQFCESCEPLTDVAEPEVDDLAAAIPEARALKELPPNMVFDLSLSLPIMRKYR
jgi:hypothetical protein